MLGGAHIMSFPSFQVLVPTRVGQVYVYDSPKGEQVEYDFPRHLISTGSQEIYDVPPVRGGVPSQFSQEVRVLGVSRGNLWFLPLRTGDDLSQPEIRYQAKLYPKLYFMDLVAASQHLHHSQLLPERRWVATPSLTHCPMSSPPTGL